MLACVRAHANVEVTASSAGAAAASAAAACPRRGVPCSAALTLAQLSHVAKVDISDTTVGQRENVACRRHGKSGLVRSASRQCSSAAAWLPTPWRHPATANSCCSEQSCVKMHGGFLDRCNARRPSLRSSQCAAARAQAQQWQRHHMHSDGSGSAAQRWQR